VAKCLDQKSDFIHAHSSTRQLDRLQQLLPCKCVQWSHGGFTVERRGCVLQIKLFQRATAQMTRPTQLRLFKARKSPVVILLIDLRIFHLQRP